MPDGRSVIAVTMPPMNPTNWLKKSSLSSISFFLASIAFWTSATCGPLRPRSGLARRQIGDRGHLAAHVPVDLGEELLAFLALFLLGFNRLLDFGHLRLRLLERNASALCPLRGQGALQPGPLQ